MQMTVERPDHLAPNSPAGAGGSPACCAPAARRRLGVARSCAAAAGWAVPGAILALLPKCPACVAGHVAVATGLGISVAAASVLRNAAIVLCIATLILIACKTLHRCATLRKSR